MRRPSLFLLALTLAGCAAHHAKPEASAPPATQAAEKPLSLGNFSISLTVKDLAASRAFYEKLGFRAVPGVGGRNWLILQNDTATIGLFQGMFDRNTLTFNPGWDRAAKPLARFEDVRDLQRRFKDKGLIPVVAADESTPGPASFMLIDPDGNPVLFDQHVPRPQK
jgi:catechol 2,3-dioxygenase-like lactoylglutathione lyase family enzyme